MISSPTGSQKKAVRLMINDPDGSVHIEEASPVSQSRKRILIQSPSSNHDYKAADGKEDDTFVNKSKIG